MYRGQKIHGNDFEKKIISYHFDHIRIRFVWLEVLYGCSCSVLDAGVYDSGMEKTTNKRECEFAKYLYQLVLTARYMQSHISSSPGGDLLSDLNKENQNIGCKI